MDLLLGERRLEDAGDTFFLHLLRPRDGLEEERAACEQRPQRRRHGVHGEVVVPQIHFRARQPLCTHSSFGKC